MSVAESGRHGFLLVVEEELSGYDCAGAGSVVEEEENVSESKLLMLGGVVSEAEVAAWSDLEGETSIVLLKTLSLGVEQQVVADCQV